MQYLMVLLVSVGVCVLMVLVVVGVSYWLGVVLHSRGDSRADPSNSDPCAQCQADRDWYENLPLWQQNVVTAWWLANRYRCAAKDCR